MTQKIYYLGQSNEYLKQLKESNECLISTNKILDLQR